MAEQKKKKITPSVGFYSEPGFVSLTTSLRKVSGDDTIPADEYVDIYKNIYDLITPDEDISTAGGVIDVKLKKDTNELIVYYSDDTYHAIALEDDYIIQVFYDSVSNLVYFITKKGEKITLDLGFLRNQFATKSELKALQNEVVGLQSTVTELQDAVKNAESTIGEVQETVNGLQGSVDGFNTTINDFSNQMNQFSDRFNDIEQSFTDMENSFTEFEQSFNEIEKSFEEIENSYGEIKDFVGNVENNVVEINKSIENIENDIEIINQYIDNGVDNIRWKTF
jgi:methyl-accepting chemotaxis protein